MPMLLSFCTLIHLHVDETSWQILKDHMRQSGSVLRANILTGKHGQSKGCGIVKYAAAEDARRAIANLNYTVLDGRTIFVREYQEQPRGNGNGSGGSSGPAGESSKERVDCRNILSTGFCRYGESCKYNHPRGGQSGSGVGGGGSGGWNGGGGLLPGGSGIGGGRPMGGARLPPRGNDAAIPCPSQICAIEKSGTGHLPSVCLHVHIYVIRIYDVSLLCCSTVILPPTNHLTIDSFFAQCLLAPPPLSGRMEESHRCFRTCPLRSSLRRASR